MKMFNEGRLEKLHYDEVLEYIKDKAPINETGEKWGYLYDVLLKVDDKEDMDYILKNSHNLYQEGIAVYQYEDAFLLGLLKDNLKPEEYSFVDKHGLDFSPKGSYKELVREIIYEIDGVSGTTEICKSIEEHDEREVKIIELFNSLVEFKREDIQVLIVHSRGKYLSIEVVMFNDQYAVFYGLEDACSLFEIPSLDASTCIMFYSEDMFDKMRDLKNIDLSISTL